MGARPWTAHTEFGYRDLDGHALGAPPGLDVLLRLAALNAGIGVGSGRCSCSSFGNQSNGHLTSLAVSTPIRGCRV
jgi:hypothetical protein